MGNYELGDTITPLVWGPDLFSGGRRKGLETLAAFPCALGM